jgi:zinc finger MYND domain-containing protein 10
MFISQDTNRKYEITTFRKQNLLRLRKYLNETLLDQLPVLNGMLRALEEMSMMGDNNIAQKNSFIVQQLPEMRVKIMKGRDWHAIAKYQLDNFFNKDKANPQEELASLLKLYGSDVYEQFLEDPKCAECGENAAQRCSKCKNEWYCSRECQLKRWKQHKEMCAMLTKIRKEEEERNEEIKKMQKDNVENVNHTNVKAKKKPLIQELN